MPFAACIVPAAPVRKSPSHESEMVNQMLWGEVMEVLEITSLQWCYIRSLPDGYEGWMHNLQIESIDERVAVSSNKWIVRAPAITARIEMGAALMNVPVGATLLEYNSGKGNIGNIKYECSKNDALNTESVTVKITLLEQLMNQWLNAPYMWGGRTMLGVDCSGLTQVIFKILGINLLRDASQQATQGTVVDFLQQVQCGDLAFFDDEAGSIYHVGILLNSREIMHASGKVRIDTIDNAGILHRDTGVRTHTLRIIKRYF